MIAVWFAYLRLNESSNPAKYGIHDISAVDPDPISRLPRFNMPLELGLFLGCKRFGKETQQKKRTLILDAEPYRYQQFISDLSGHDIHAHRGEPERAIREVRTWLADSSRHTRLPGGADIISRYHRFLDDLPAICTEAHLEIGEITFNDLQQMIVDWLRGNR